MGQIITPDNPNPQPEVPKIRYDQLLAVVVHKLAPAGITISPLDLKDFMSGDMLLMNAVSAEGIDLKVVTKEEAKAILESGQQVGHA